MDSIWILSFFLYILQYVTNIASKKGFGPGEQDWGYVKIREHGQMFWWLYYVNPPVKPDNFSFFHRPLLIWLQGGPGKPSTGIGNFEEFGPFDSNLKHRNHTWVNYYNVLFIDNPLGAGFSYAKTSNDHSFSSSENAHDIFICIRAVLNKIKDFEQVPTYILSQSYAGKFAVKLARIWYTHEKKGFMKSNLKGVALGNSWISPIDTIRSWAPYLLEMGLIDTVQSIEINNMVNRTIKAIHKKYWHRAKNLMDDTYYIIWNYTDNVNNYNILKEQLSITPSQSIIFNNSNMVYNTIKINDKLDFILNAHVASALNLSPANWTSFSWKVYHHYVSDFMQSATRNVEHLLDKTDLQIIVYHGQLDTILPVHGTLTWVENLKWKYSSEWFNQTRNSLKINGVVQGYVKSYKNLKMYWIDRAGHMVPKDNPYAMLAILKAMTEAN